MGFLAGKKGGGKEGRIHGSSQQKFPHWFLISDSCVGRCDDCWSLARYRLSDAMIQVASGPDGDGGRG